MSTSLRNGWGRFFLLRRGGSFLLRPYILLCFADKVPDEFFVLFNDFRSESLTLEISNK